MSCHLLLLLVSGLAQGQSPQFTVTNLGVLSGKPSSFATSINDSGVVVGIAADAPFQPPFRAIRIENGTVTDLGSVSGTSQAYGINNAGMIAGVDTGSDGIDRAMVLVPGFAMRLLPSLGGSGGGFGAAVSGDGRVVGYSTSGASSPAINPATGEVYLTGRHATLWNPNGPNSHAAPIDLGTVGDGDSSFAFGVNSSGVVLGQSMSATGWRAVIWDAANGLRLLPEPAGRIQTFGRAISDTGIGTGFVTFASGNEIFRWTQATGTQVLGKCAGAQHAFPNGINNAGQIVGTCRYSYGDRAAALINGVFVDLNTVLDSSGASWTLLSAWGVNSAGAIVGHGMFNGQVRAYLLTPARQPAVISLGNLSHTYDGSPKSPTVTTVPPGLSYSLQGAPQTNAGSYPVVATITDPGYTGSANGTLIISPAAATVSLTNLTQISDGTPKSPTVVTSPAGLSYVLSGAPQTNPGTYPVSATITNPNYSGSAAADFVLLSPGTVVVRLVNSSGSGISGGVVQYYSSGWQSFGTTDASGQTTRVLPAGTYSFAMDYAGARIQISQNTASSPIVTFQTRAVQVLLRDSQNRPLDTGTTQYYASGWRPFGTGTTVGGQAGMELLPASYSFSMTYGGQPVQKAQDISSNPIVTFQSRSVQVLLRDSQNRPLDTGTVQYYASGWKPFGSGTTSGGQVTAELLPASYSFSMNYGGQPVQRTQDITSNATVTFQTGLVQVSLRDSLNNPLDTGTVEYYASGWKTFGTGATVGGSVAMELLPANYSFAMNYAGGRAQISQDVSIDPNPIFQTGSVDSLSNTAIQYYGGGWRTFSDLMQLLPGSYTFRFNDGFANTAFTILGGRVNQIH